MEKQIKLYATRSMRVHGKQVEIGEPFEVSEPVAKTILRIGRATKEDPKKTKKEDSKKLPKDD